MYISRDAEPGLLSWLGRFKRPVVWLDLECLVKDMDMRSIPGGARLYRCLKDEEAAVGMALDALAGLGHTRIGFPIFRSPEFPWILHRSAVLKECAAARHPHLTIVENEHKEGFWHPKPWLGPEDFPAWLGFYRGNHAGGRRKSLGEMIPSLMDMLDKEKSARFGGPVTAMNGLAAVSRLLTTVVPTATTRPPAACVALTASSCVCCLRALARFASNNDLWATLMSENRTGTTPPG